MVRVPEKTFSKHEDCVISLYQLSADVSQKKDLEKGTRHFLCMFEHGVISINMNMN